MDIVHFLLVDPINATKHVKNVSLLCPFVSICVHLFKNTKKTKNVDNLYDYIVLYLHKGCIFVS